MGNLLDLQNCCEFEPEKKGEDAMDAQGRPSVDVKTTYYMTDVENDHLRESYDLIYSNGDDLPSREGLRKALHQEKNELLLTTFADWLLSRHIRSYEQFQRAIITAARVSSGRTIESMWEVANFCRLEGDGDRSTLFLFCRLTFLLISEKQDVEDVQELDRAATMLQKFFLSASRRVNPDSDIETNLDRFVSTVHEFAPHIAKAFHTYLSVHMLLASDNPSFKPYISPILSHKTEVAAQLELNALALYCEELQSNWERLYSTSADGLSFNRISHHIAGYDGPVCMLIKCSNPPGSVFGALTMERWKELNKFFGSPKTILFTLTPELRIFRTKSPGNGAYQWLNSKAFNFPHGLGLGGTMEEFRVFIPDNLENCIARDAGPTYEDGKLLVSGEEFQIDSLEMWGCGGHSRVEVGLKARQESRKIIEDSLAKARKVDKAAFFDSSFDREFLLTSTFSHDKEKQERLEEY